jgi:hypothetical protein
MKQTLPLWIIAGLGSALQAYYLTQLPERVAVHFNAAGVADNWASPMVLATSAWGALGIVTLIGSGSILLMGRVPDQLINLPNKKYWLDPVRRDETIAWLQRFAVVLLSMPLVLLVVVFHRVYEFNRGNHEALGPSMHGTIVAVVIVMTIGSVVVIFRKFRNPPDDFNGTS